MYLYNSLRSCTRSLNSNVDNQFILLPGKADSNKLSTHNDFNYVNHHISDSWDEKDSLKIDSWAETFELSANELPPRPEKLSNHRPRPRLSPCRKLLVKKLRQRFVGVNCFNHQSRSRDSGRRSPCSVRSATREATSKAKLYMSEVSQKLSSSPRPTLRQPEIPQITINSPLDETSSGRRIIDELELCASRPKRKPRRVTTYHSAPKVVEYRAPRPVGSYYAPSYSSSRENVRPFTGEKVIISRIQSYDTAPVGKPMRKPVGRHLEWLKFLA